MDEDEIRNMEMREFREEFSSGLVSLFSEPEIRFLLDALLESAPNSTFTPEWLQEQSGVDGTAFSDAFETLLDTGFVVPSESGAEDEYVMWTDNPIYRHLVQLNSAVQHMTSEEGRKAREARAEFPPTRYTYSCPECGGDREFESGLPHGSVYSCQQCSHKWVFPSRDTPERVDNFYTELGIPRPVNEEN